MSPSRKKIMERIAALKAKTVANGCTEVEAMAAAEKVAQLMSDYDICDDEGLDESTCRKGWAEAAEDDPVVRCATAVGYFTDTKVWIEKAGNEPIYDGEWQIGWRHLPHRVVFFGLPHDTEIAGYMFEICRSALARSSEAYRAGISLFRAKVRERKLREFQWGMADSMADQLRKMRDQRRARAGDTGRGLVTVKQALIERDFAALGIDLRSNGNYRKAVDDGAYLDGRRAGSAVTFNEGLRHEGGAGALIGGPKAAR